MAYKIIAALCTSCSACEAECPNGAIREKDAAFVIKATKCTECIGFFDEPQCAAVCPVENACVIDDSVPGSGDPAAASPASPLPPLMPKGTIPCA